MFHPRSLSVKYYESVVSIRLAHTYKKIYQIYIYAWDKACNRLLWLPKVEGGGGQDPLTASTIAPKSPSLASAQMMKMASMDYMSSLCCRL